MAELNRRLRRSLFDKDLFEVDDEDELEGGIKTMETKSRYEVIAELEEKKRELIIQRDSLDTVLKGKTKELKELNRDVEDKEEEIKDFKDSMVETKETISALIKSVDESLERFSKIQKKS